MQVSVNVQIKYQNKVEKKTTKWCGQLKTSTSVYENALLMKDQENVQPGLSWQQD